MKDRVILYLAGFSAATIAGLGVMLHQAMNVEATTRNDVNTATTHFTCSWDGMCARFPVRPL